MHVLQRSVTVSLQNSEFDNVLAKCTKVVGHFKHSPANAAELEQQQIEHGQKKKSLIQDSPTRWTSIHSGHDLQKQAAAQERPHNTKVAMATTAGVDICISESCCCTEAKFKDLKCLPRSERAEVLASVTNLLKERRVVGGKPVEATTSEPPEKKLALLVASSECEQEEDSAENSVVDTEQSPPSVQRSVHWSAAPNMQHGLTYLATAATSVPVKG